MSFKLLNLGKKAIWHKPSLQVYPRSLTVGMLYYWCNDAMNSLFYIWTNSWALNCKEKQKKTENHSAIILNLHVDWLEEKNKAKRQFKQNTLTFTAMFPLNNHFDIINSSNTASLQRQWCLGAGVTCMQHYRISRYLTQTCCGVLTLIPGLLESPVCVTLSCLIPIISQPQR